MTLLQLVKPIIKEVNERTNERRLKGNYLSKPLRYFQR
jgi:hypothetical protein